MKLAHAIAAQVAFLVGAVLAGGLLNNDLADGPRTLHRLVGGLSFIAGVHAFALVIKRSAPTKVKVLSGASVVFTLVAAFSGRSLATASDYDMMFSLMRLGGLFALVCAAVSLFLLRGSKKV